MARKRKHPEHVNHERWLVSYADFITLLFAFFVVMFAASNADQKKAGQIAQAVQVAFSELAVFTPSGKVMPLSDEGGLASAPQRVVGGTKSPFAEATQINDPNHVAMVTIQLERMLMNEVQNHMVRISQDSRGIVLSLAESGFFNSGSALVNPRGLPVLERIAERLRELPEDVRVEGHTDTTPIHTAQFPSNWELSTARATHVLQFLLTEAKVPPERLSAVGYGEYRPAASNATAEGRAANRRVDLVIIGGLGKQLEPPKKDPKETQEPASEKPLPAAPVDHGAQAHK